jgi:hypothetical protein
VTQKWAIEEPELVAIKSEVRELKAKGAKE